MPADIRTAFPVPAFGAPSGCSGGGGSCGCGGSCGGSCSSCSSGCDASSTSQGLAPVPIPQADGADTPWSSCPGGSPSYRGVAVGDALDTFAAIARRTGMDLLDLVALSEDCGTWDLCRMKLKPMTSLPPSGPTGGADAILQLQPPQAGVADPRPLLTYNSVNQLQASVYGSGWDDAYRRRVSNVDSTTADVITGRGVTYRYINLDAGTNYYTPPGEARNSLHKESDGGWTETQADGALFRYDSGGKMKFAQGVGNLRVTVAYVGSSTRINYLQAPTGARTTYAYGGSLGNEVLKRIVDPANRITSFSISSPGAGLTRMITPDTRRVTLSYAGTLPTALIDADGERITLAYVTTPVASVKRITLPGGQITTYQTRSSPTRVAVINPRAGRTTVLFDANTNVQAIRNALDQRTTYSWTSNQLQAVRLASGARTTLTYATISGDNTQRLQTLRLPISGRWSLAYDSSGRLTSLQDPMGRRTTLRWDGSGNRTVAIDALTNRTSFSYETSGLPRATINPLGARVTVLYDASNRVVATINPLGNRTSLSYNSYSQVRRVQNALGNITTSLWDVMNRLSATINPLGARTTQTYYDDGHLKAVINALGQRTTNLYDTNGRLMATVDGLGNRTSFSYDGNNNLIRTVNALGNIFTSVYDTANRRIALIDPLLNRTSMAYDSIGNRVRTVNALGKITTSVHDQERRLISAINPVLARTSVVYDNASNPIRVQDPLSNITTSVFDVLNRVKAIVNAIGNRTSLVFDSAGQQVALIDANGNRATSIYDLAGQMTITVDPLLRRVTVGYDAAGQRTQRTDPRGYRTTFLYDEARRLQGRRYPDGSRVTFTYDSIGQRALMLDATGRTTSTYDEANRLKTVTNPAGKRTTSSYDAIAQKIVLVDPESGRFSFAYDAAARPIRVINPQGERTTAGYDVVGRRIWQRLANGIRVSLSYDDADQLKRLVNLNSAMTTLSSFDYLTDSAGNRTRVKEATTDRVTWSYDKTYQLIRERRSGTNAYDVTYSYDPVGNRRTKDEAGIRTTLSYDTANQLKLMHDNTGRTTFSFDQAGNQLRKITPAGARTTYLWNYENGLIGVRLPSGIRNTVIYDGVGKRVQVENSVGITKFIWSRESVIQETDGNNAVQATYTLWPFLYGDLVSQRRGSTTSFQLFDGLGSVDRLTNSSGDVTDSYLYYAFGSLRTSNGTTTNRFRYLGRYGYAANVDLDHYYVRARYYDPNLGLWMSSDPLRYSNLYWYVSNNPINATDPSGLQDELSPLVLCLAGALGGGLAASVLPVQLRLPAAQIGCICALTVCNTRALVGDDCTFEEAFLIGLFCLPVLAALSGFGLSLTDAGLLGRQLACFIQTSLPSLRVSPLPMMSFNSPLIT